MYIMIWAEREENDLYIVYQYPSYSDGFVIPFFFSTPLDRTKKLNQNSFTLHPRLYLPPSCSYVGPFTKVFRDQLMGQEFLPYLQKEFQVIVTALYFVIVYFEAGT